MDNRGGRGRDERHHGEAVGNGGPGGRRGREFNGAQERGPGAGHDAAGYPQGRRLRRHGGEGNGKAGDGGYRSGGDNDENPNLGGEQQKEPDNGKEEDASGGRGGWDNRDAEAESLRLQGPGDQSVQRGDKKTPSREEAHFSRGGVPAGGGGDLVDVSATSKETATFSAVEPEGKKIGATATLTSTPLLPYSTFLTDALLSWTISDVLNEDLYKDKVKHIPVQFDAPHQFIDVYSGMIMEETRSEICSGISSRGRSQYCQLTSITECDSPHAFFLDLDLPLTRSDEVHCHHIANDFDICLLSYKSPKDPNLDITCCSLGLVIGVGRDTFFQRSFRVLVSKQGMFQKERVKFVSFLTNIKHNVEIAKIISLTEYGSNHCIQALLQLYKMVGKTCNTCLHSSGNESPFLNLRCFHQKLVEVVWSPAGSMKDYFGGLKDAQKNFTPKVLICLPNASVLPDFLMDYFNEISDSTDSLSDILVLNDARDMKKCDMFNEVFLEHRSHGIFCYLSKCIDWLKGLCSLLDLTAYFPHCTESATCEICNNSTVLTFSVESFVMKFDMYSGQVTKCLDHLRINSAELHLHEQNKVKVKELLATVEQLGALLHDSSLREDRVQKLFGLIPSSDVVEMDNVYKSLNDARLSSIRLIGSLVNSIQLPELGSREEMERLCVKHSKIIVSTLDCLWRLYDMDDSFDVLLIQGANQIKEVEFLLALLCPVRHIVFFGDQFHRQPVVQSKLCKQAGFGISIYERLQRLVPEKQILTRQHVMHGLINKIINCHFYNERFEVGPAVTSLEYNREVESLRLPFISIMDIPPMQSSDSRNGYIIPAMLFILLQQLSKDLMNLDRKFSICVVCLSKNEANAVQHLLRTDDKINERFNLEVSYIGDLEGDLFDVIIISTIAEDDAEINSVNKNFLNVALTSTRHSCCMVGRCKTLFKSGGIWKDLVQHAWEKNLIKKVHENELIEVMKNLENNGSDHMSDANYIFSKKMHGQEFTWVDRPYRTKYILAAVRDQRGQPDTCTLQATCGAVESLMKLHNARLSPPQDCIWDLSVDDLKKRYETSVGKKLRSENIADRGKRRLNVVLESFKSYGVVGRNKTKTKSRIIKILSYEKVEHRDTEHVTKLLEEGNFMVGHFRLSSNYFTLKPGEVYVFDEKKAFIHPKSNLVASHAVMMIGIGHRQTGPRRFTRHMVMQNSEGKLFGINGIGRVGKSQTVRGLYRMVVDMPHEGLVD